MRSLFKAGLAICAIALLWLGLRHAGPALVINAPQKADLILVLAGDENDLCYWKAVNLLRAGYARRMLVDASVDSVAYGRTPAQLEEEFIQRSAPGLAVGICPMKGKSTLEEMASVKACFQSAAPAAG